MTRLAVLVVSALLTMLAGALPASGVGASRPSVSITSLLQGMAVPPGRVITVSGVVRGAPARAVVVLQQRSLAAYGCGRYTRFPPGCPGWQDVGTWQLRGTKFEVRWKAPP